MYVKTKIKLKDKQHLITIVTKISRSLSVIRISLRAKKSQYKLQIASPGIAMT